MLNYYGFSSYIWLTQVVPFLQELPTMEDHYNTIEDEAFPPLPPPHSPGGQENGDPFGNGEKRENIQI